MRRAAALICAGIGAAVPAATPAAADELLFFRSPSGNIHCLLTDGEWAGARCDILQFTPSFTRAPPGCDLDWGMAFWVAPSGPGELACVSDSVAEPTAQTLPYGGTISLGGISCTSEKTGMTCVNRQGHGFRVARARQELF
jgi:hypothetical protein